MKPLHIVGIAMFVLPGLIMSITPKWPGNAVAGTTFVVLVIAAIALEQQRDDD